MKLFNSSHQARMALVANAKSYAGTMPGSTGHKRLQEIYNQQEPLPRGYAITLDDAYCAAGLCAIAIEAGVARVIPMECSVPKMVEIAKRWKIWQEDDDIWPLAGDLIVYDWDDDGRGDNHGSPDHIGIVVNSSDNDILVFECNKGRSGVCDYRKVTHNGKFIRGYICPDYGELVDPMPDKGKPLDEVAREVIRGEWGNGTTRRKKLEAAGYNFADVQIRVNQLLEKPSKHPAGKTLDDLAREVILGYWGNGQARKDRLEAAGYNYKDVQHRVNEMLD